MKKRIFLIEDEIDFIEIYQSIFKKEDFEFEAVRFGVEAEKEFEKWIKKEKEKPDIILLDLLLPDTNGILLLEKLKKENELKKIPVYILSNFTPEELELGGTERKAEKYFLKTEILPTELFKIIKEALAKSGT